MGFETQVVRGVTNHYGPRSTAGKYGGLIDDDYVKTVVWTFNYNDLPAAGTSAREYVLPAGAVIRSARLEVITAFTSTSTTTDLTIGLQTSAGVEIDNDGLVTAANADQTAIGTAGNLITGSGALVGKSIGATAGEVVVTPSASDLLTGKGRVIVEYIYGTP